MKNILLTLIPFIIEWKDRNNVLMTSVLWLNDCLYSSIRFGDMSQASLMFKRLTKDTFVRNWLINDEEVEIIIQLQKRCHKIIVSVFSPNNEWNQHWQDVLHLQSTVDEEKETENWVLKLLADWALADRMICQWIGEIQCHMRRMTV